MTPYEKMVKDFKIQVGQWRDEGMPLEDVKFLQNNAEWLGDCDFSLTSEIKAIYSFYELEGRGCSELTKTFYSRFTLEQLDLRYRMATMVFKLRFPDKFDELVDTLRRLPESYDSAYAWNKDPIYKRKGFFSKLFGK